MNKTVFWIQHTQKRIEAKKKKKKNGGKDLKVLYKLMNNVVYGKKIENLRNRLDVKLIRNKKDCLEWASKRSYMPYKIFDNDAQKQSYINA